MEINYFYKEKWIENAFHGYPVLFVNFNLNDKIFIEHLLTTGSHVKCLIDTKDFKTGGDALEPILNTL